MLEPGMRVRCVDAGATRRNLVQGEEYTVCDGGSEFVALKGIGGLFCVSRFKPIVRVNMGRAVQ